MSLGNCEHGHPWGECCEISRKIERLENEIERLRTERDLWKSRTEQLTQKNLLNIAQLVCASLA